MSATPCTCPLAGFCSRHNLEKPGRLFELCQSDRRYFERWERMQNTPQAAQRAAARAKRVAIFHALWRELHVYRWTSADAAERWFATWERRIPRFGCKCRRHWEKIKLERAPDFSSAEAFFEWGVWAHNRVNEELGKALMAIESARKLYR